MKITLTPSFSGYPLGIARCSRCRCCRLLSMRMPASKTSSFSVRDILDLGPKQAAVRDTGETQLAGIKTEPAPATPPAPPRPGYLQGARPPFPFPHHWSQLSPFLAHNKCKILALCLQMEYALCKEKSTPDTIDNKHNFLSFQWTQ